MTGTVIQVSIGPGGVPNHAIEQGAVTTRGITGDTWHHPAFHGTPRRAILLITSEGIDELVAQGFPVYPGALGENITTQGLDRHSLRLDQHFQVGEAVIELTQVRLPCDTLSVYGTGIQSAMYDARAQAGDATTPVWGLSGFYACVIEPGILRTGDAIALINPAP